MLEVGLGFDQLQRLRFDFLILDFVIQFPETLIVEYDAAMIHNVLRITMITAAAAGWAALAAAGDDDPARVRRAVSYLDGRQDEWSRFAKAQRGEGADKTTCVSCHTGISYVLAHPDLRRFAEKPGPAAAEERTIAAVSLRVEHWAELDTPRFRLMYDSDDDKKAESRGTEAVVNALILARDDATHKRDAPSAATRTALQHLWKTQAMEGSAAGSWDWLNFGLAPWEADGSRAFGAALAAIAVGSAPGYLDQKHDEATSRGIRSLRDYLRRGFPEESLYNRLWILEASTTWKDLLSADQKRQVIDQLLAARRADGGWALASLGNFKRVDGTPQAQDSDGYATGLAVHALLRGGSPATRPEVTQGLDWLRSHQQEDGSWPGRSVNKKRDPATFVGKLMSDAATAIAAQVFVEADGR
jgi:squalene-hopene/tetraprenyl-beta-curcumene cyclase